MKMNRNRIQLFSLIAVSMLAHVTMGGGRVAASLFVLHQGYSAAMAGFAYSAYSLLPALLSLMMGKWIDRVGPRHVMRISQVLMVTSLLVPAMWPSLMTVMAAALAGGFGFGSYMLAANVAVSIMPFQAEGERVGMLGWLAMGNSVAAVGGPAVAGLVIDHGGFAAAYGVMALIVCASLLVSFLVDVPGGVGGLRQKQGGTGVLRQVFSTPRLLRIYLLAMVVSVAFDGYAFMTPVLGHVRGYSATLIGATMSCFACGSFVVRALLPWLSRRLAEWRMLVMAYGVIAVAFCLLPVVPNAYMHGALGFCIGLAAGAGQPNILSLIYRAMPDRAGEGAGLRAMVGNSMGATGPWIYGSITGLVGAAPVFLMIGVLAAMASWQSRCGYRLSLGSKNGA